MSMLIDFNSCKAVSRFYGGNAGRKECIFYNDACWLIKYPENTAGMKGDILSYTTSPVSEYLGSHVYAMVGIPVHETILGQRNGKVVVACRDFTDTLAAGERFYSFHDLKNNTAGDAITPDGRASSGATAYLSDVLSTLYLSPVIRDVPGVIERFWDMFVTDALIGNADRNNENWGFFSSLDGVIRLAPVYDNGNSFFNKRRPESNARSLENENSIRSLALDAPVSFYLRDDGQRVRPFAYIASGADSQCLKAVKRLVNRFDLAQFEELLATLPSEALGMPIMPNETRELLMKVVRTRFVEGLAPNVDKC